MKQTWSNSKSRNPSAKGFELHFDIHHIETQHVAVFKPDSETSAYQIPNTEPSIGHENENKQ